MTTIELTDAELAVVRSALESYLEDFGHEEQDTVNVIQGVYMKLGGDLAQLLR